MSALIQVLSTLVAMVAVFVWLLVPELQPWSLQAFLVMMLLYFGLKRWHKAQLWHIAPTQAFLELPLLTFAILLVISTTGLISSPFFALVYVYLFFVILAGSVSSSLVTMGLLITFFFATSPELTLDQVITLSTLPLITILFLFGKHQHELAQADRHLLKTEESLLDHYLSEDSNLHDFLQQFLKPKLELLQQLSQYPEHNHRALQGQLSLLLIELDKVLADLNNPQQDQK